MTAVQEEIKALADSKLYPAVLALFGSPPPGRILDVPAGHGAFAKELLERGYSDIHCLDINAENFKLRGVSFQKYDAADKLPFPDNHFDYVFSVEGIEHFEAPFPFVKELCRVLRPGGRLYLTTPNTFSVEARLKYLVSGYFPRFRPLMQNPEQVMAHPVDDAHIAPIYFWQIYYFLMLGGIKLNRISTNDYLYKRNWLKRAIETLFARAIRRNIRKRNFPDHGVTAEAMLYGDCIILEGVKEPR